MIRRCYPVIWIRCAHASKTGYVAGVLKLRRRGHLPIRYTRYRMETGAGQAVVSGDVGVSLLRERSEATDRAFDIVNELSA